MKLSFPWHYIISWPFYFLWPSTQKHSRYSLLPSTRHFVNTKKEDVLRLLFFGDLMCTKSEDIPLVHPKLKTIFQTADFVIGNCESPVIRYSKNKNAREIIIRHQMSEMFLQEFLSALGVELDQCILSVANNHIGDQGAKGLETTLYHLKHLGIIPLGYRRPDRVPYVKVACKGITCGISAWTQWLNKHAFKRFPGVWNLRQIERQNWNEIKKSEKIDCLIGFPHWEYEFHHFPRAGTRKIAQDLAKQGFDVIVGHHPHVLQPLERFGKTICLYSIGNLNAPSFINLRWPIRLSAIFEVQIVSSGPNRGKIAGYTLHFYVQQRLKKGNFLIPIDESFDQMITQKMLKRLSMLFPTV